MKIFFLNNDGGGFADQIDIPEGTTLGQLFARRSPTRPARLPHPRQSPARGCR